MWAGMTGCEENEVAVALVYSLFLKQSLCSNGSVRVWDVDRTVIVKEFSGIEGIPRGLGVIRNEK